MHALNWWSNVCERAFICNRVLPPPHHITNDSKVKIAFEMRYSTAEWEDLIACGWSFILMVDNARWRACSNIMPRCLWTLNDRQRVFVCKCQCLWPFAYNLLNYLLMLYVECVANCPGRMDYNQMQICNYYCYELLIKYIWFTLSIQFEKIKKNY